MGKIIPKSVKSVSTQLLRVMVRLIFGFRVFRVCGLVSDFQSFALSPKVGSNLLDVAASLFDHRLLLSFLLWLLKQIPQSPKGPSSNIVSS